jgi:hypothetical protein
MGFPQQPVPERVKKELAGWQDMAAMWPLRFSIEDPYARCEACDQAVIRLLDDAGNGYSYTRLQLVTLAVAHIRQVHGDKPPA